MQAKRMKHSNYLAKKYLASMEAGESLARLGSCREIRFYISYQWSTLKCMWNNRNNDSNNKKA